VLRGWPPRSAQPQRRRGSRDGRRPAVAPARMRRARSGNAGVESIQRTAPRGSSRPGAGCRPRQRPGSSTVSAWPRVESESMQWRRARLRPTRRHRRSSCSDSSPPPTNAAPSLARDHRRRIVPNATGPSTRRCTRQEDLINPEGWGLSSSTSGDQKLAIDNDAPNQRQPPRWSGWTKLGRAQERCWAVPGDYQRPADASSSIWFGCLCGPIVSRLPH
jgi:hypothetical protein